ncbi:MAG: LPS export ABC transporter periplasmic protein LptC [Cytophagales bacterium]|nr:LPS export ABC transporter periplasmic protein LptC [Bernardetiaceae bacterium]MDW8203395.1 LPS export ABC transporter periplasmic protein LptC [Cytophagales bacterium]
MNYKTWRLIIGTVILAIDACTPQDLQKSKAKAQYSGPMVEFYQVETLYSDNAIIQLKIEAQQQHIFQNGDVKYPKGVKISRYDPYGVKISTLRGDSGSYDKARQLYQAFGNIEVENLQLQQRLYTTQLDWDQPKREIRTDKPIKIVTPDEILEGVGLVADESFTRYRILRPSGVFSVRSQ